MLPRSHAGGSSWLLHGYPLRTNFSYSYRYLYRYTYTAVRIHLLNMSLHTVLVAALAQAQVFRRDVVIPNSGKHVVFEASANDGALETVQGFAREHDLHDGALAA